MYLFCLYVHCKKSINVGNISRKHIDHVVKNIMVNTEFFKMFLMLYRKKYKRYQTGKSLT